MRAILPSPAGPENDGHAAAPAAGLKEPLRLDEESLGKEEIDAGVELVAKFPDDAQAVLLLGLTYSHLGDLAAAEKWFDRCLGLKPAFLSAYDDIGGELIATMKYEKALAVYREGVGREPRLAPLQFGEGRALMLLGRPAEAVQALELAVQRPRPRSEYYALLCEAYVKVKNYEKAREAGERAIAIQPVDPRAYWVLAAACAGLGQDQEAEQYRKKFGERDTREREVDRPRRRALPNAEIAATNAAWTLDSYAAVYQRRQCPDKAEELLVRAGAIDPKNVEPRARLAALYVGRKRLAEALALSDEIARLDPRSSSGPLIAGNVYDALGRADQAEADYRKAIDLAPEQADAYRDLARLYLKTGRDPAEAKRLAQSAVRLAPVPAHLAVLGDACAANDDLAGARAAYELALRIDPGNAEIRRGFEKIQGRK